MLVYFLILFNIFNVIFLFPSCKEGENFCSRCNPITKLCIKCKDDFLTPNFEGGCDYLKECQIGKNHCNECSNNRDLCILCEDNYFPDDNGGCSYTDNCKISKNGLCYRM